MMKNTRMSRTNHPIPRLGNVQYDLSGLRGTAYRDGTVLREAKDPPAAPVKTRPDPGVGRFPLTPAPKANTQSVADNGEAKKHKTAGVSTTGRTSRKRG